MTDIKTENKYITYMMEKLPETQKGEARVLKKGDSLWNIAKEAVGGQKASNAEISEYMLLIAKTNGLDTYEKMNKIKVADTIYMPKVDKSQKTAEKKPVARTRAEESALAVISKLYETEGLKVQKANLMYKSNMYHVFAKNDSNPEYGNRLRPVMSFSYDNKNQFSKMSFEDSKENINTYGYDYDLDANGRISARKGYDDKQVGTLGKESMDKLKTKLEELIPTAIQVI